MAYSFYSSLYKIFIIFSDISSVVKWICHILNHKTMLINHSINLKQHLQLLVELKFYTFDSLNIFFLTFVTTLVTMPSTTLMRKLQNNFCHLLQFVSKHKNILNLKIILINHSFNLQRNLQPQVELKFYISTSEWIFITIVTTLVTMPSTTLLRKLLCNFFNDTKIF